MLIRPLEEQQHSNQNKSEKWKEGNREGEELPIAVHMCTYLMFLSQITFSTVQTLVMMRELGPAACVEDFFKVWLVWFCMEEATTNLDFN